MNDLLRCCFLRSVSVRRCACRSCTRLVIMVSWSFPTPVVLIMPMTNPSPWLMHASISDFAVPLRRTPEPPLAAYCTLTAHAGMTPSNTSTFPFGAADLFDRECYGSNVQSAESCPWPKTPEQSNAVFDNTGKLLSDAFTHAHSVGVKVGHWWWLSPESVVDGLCSHFFGFAIALCGRFS